MSKCWRNKIILKTQITTSLHKKDYISIMFVSDEFKYKLMCL